MKKFVFKKRKIKFIKYITKTRLLIVLFLALFIGYNYYQFKTLMPERTYYTSKDATTFPIIYQDREGKKINLLRGYKSEKYKDIMNETLTVLNNDNREINFVLDKNGNNIRELQYEIRNKTTNDLLERTTMNIPYTEKDEVNIVFRLQNLIEEKTSYSMTIKIDMSNSKIYYFTNIILKKKTVIDNALAIIEEFTEKTFDKLKATELVKYLETNPNVDQRQMYNVNIKSSFDQLTWAETNMKRITDYYYSVYQAQDYCFNVNVDYLTFCKNDKNQNEYYKVKDEYVVRWDNQRFYFMKIERSVEEYFNIDNDIYDVDKKRLYLGITNLETFEKVESYNKKYIAFNKNKEIYFYDIEKQSIKNVFGMSIRDNEAFLKNNIPSSTKLLSVDDEGNVRFLLYGYKNAGADEGYVGISIYTYNNNINETSENVFVPLYTTYENLKYDLDKMCLQKGDTIYFKHFDKIYSVNILNSSTMALVENIVDQASEGSYDDLHFAYNENNETYDDVITIVNMEDMSREYIRARLGEKIEVITFMNDDLFFGTSSLDNSWIENNKIIGHPYSRIISYNTVTHEQKVFEEQGFYYYNFVRKEMALHFNKYTKKGNHYYKDRNDVIINNYVDNKEHVVPIGEEYTKRKLRIAYLSIDTKREKIKKEKQVEATVRNIESEILDKEIPKEENTYYVYNNGVLKVKTRILADGINAIRDSFGYVKMNDKITCYNRSNKANLSYLRQNNSLLDNLENFHENVCLIDNKILVMNLTGITCRDLEYYISLGQKVVAYYNDTFQFFITGYDSKDYVLEYMNGERVLTSRDQVEAWIEDAGYSIFTQVANLE